MTFSHIFVYPHLTGRHLNTHRKNSQPLRHTQVNLCGSRGTGGVISFGASTFLHMFDLEEDEDSASSAADHEGFEEDEGTN